MRIALDFDGVLADMQKQVIQHTKYTREDFNTWDKRDYETFMEETRRVWINRWDDVKPVESHLDDYTAILSKYGTADIVTNTVAPDHIAEKWLDKHNIEYNDIVRAPGGDKAGETNYDCYIDDNPNMAGNVDLLYLRNKRWNQSVRGSGEYFYTTYENSDPKYESRIGGQESGPWVIRILTLRDIVSDFIITKREMEM